MNTCKINISDIPEDVILIITTINLHGYEAFIVGGCVRDLLMQNTPKDWDIATSAKPETVKSLFKKTFDTGITHGTVTVVKNKKNYEVTTYRIDGQYLDNRRPSEVFFTNSLLEDLKRRDFTMNSIAYHSASGYFDPFSGVSDIEKKIIRGVGEPDCRFKEDALRMLRAVRFSAQLNFEIEKNTYAALLNNVKLIENISIERIRDELIKTINSPNPEKIGLLVESGIMEHINKDLNRYLFVHFKEIAKYLKSCENCVMLRLVLFFMFTKKDEAYSLLLFLRLDNKTIKHVAALLELISLPFENDEYQIRKHISKYGEEKFYQALYLKELLAKTDMNTSEQSHIIAIKAASNALQDNHTASFTLKNLNITGNDLLEIGFMGKDIGNVLSYLLEIVLKNPKNNKKEILLNMAKMYRNSTTKNL